MALRIVCLDGYTLNPGDIDWSPFQSLGELLVHDRTPEDRIIERAGQARILLTNKTPLTAATLSHLAQLQYVGVLATGYNVVDTQAAGGQGVVVTNVPTYGTDSVAQHALAMMLELSRHVSLHAQAVRQGQWSRSEDFCLAVAPIRELTGLTLGLIGLGRIGQALARIGVAMGMKVLAYDQHQPDTTFLEGLGVSCASLVEQVFAAADVLSLHCPLTPETQHLVNARRLALMKPAAILVNTSRGPLVDTQALADALHAGRLAGAALDVLDVEPPPADHPLLHAPRCLITPHVAWYAREARQRLMNAAADNLRAFLAGQPIHKVN